MVLAASLVAGCLRVTRRGVARPPAGNRRATALVALLLATAPARADEPPAPCLRRSTLGETHCPQLTYDLLVRSAVTANARADKAELATAKALEERDAARERADLVTALPCPPPPSLVVPVALAATGGLVAGVLLYAWVAK